MKQAIRNPGEVLSRSNRVPREARFVSGSNSEASLSELSTQTKNRALIAARN